MPSLEEIKIKIESIDNDKRLLKCKEIKELPDILWEDETVEKLILGIYNNHAGLLVATNKRLVFVDKGFVNLKVEDFPYGNISSIQYETGMVAGKVTIFASGNRADITHVEKDRARGFSEYVRARITQPSHHASTNVDTNSTSLSVDDARISALERLASLREKGILSEEEFQSEKSRILVS